MADVVDKATRSRMMSGIRGKDTQPELFVRSGLHSLGFRYRLHVADIPGKPDLVLPKYQALILIHGCYWHGHDCRYFKLPSTNRRFWENKLSTNRTRDERVLTQQIALGWRVLIIWECAVRAAHKSSTQTFMISDVATWLRSNSQYAIIDEDGLEMHNA